MRLLHRIGYYLGGFAIGLIILSFFLKGKRASCAYFPEARVMKNIKNKAHLYSPKAEQAMRTLNLDTSDIVNILSNGDVNFDESQTRKEPCGVYIYESNEELNLKLTIENCDSITTIQDVTRLN